MKTIQDEMREAHARLTALVQGATTEDRDFTEDEEKEKTTLVARMTALDGKRKRGETFEDLLAHVGKLSPPPAAPAPRIVPATGGPNPFAAEVKSLGAMLVEHELYAALRTMPKSGIWSGPQIELQAAVTLNPTTTLVPPGTRILPFLPYPADWGVAGLFSSGTMDGGMIQYLQETVWTNAAAIVAAGAAKPESTKTFVLTTASLVKIAHFIQCVDELLEDVAGLRSFIDSQMANGVIEELNDQLINGPGGAGNIMGLIALPGKVADITTPVGVGGAATAIAQQRAAIYAASRLQPDAVVMNPKTWARISSETSTAGGYLAGPGTFGAGVPPQVWGLRVVETPEVPDGTVIIGAFRQGGQLYSKGGVSVQATNSHADFFQKNITAIRAEIRVALVIYRPQAFGLVLDALVPGP